MNSEFSSSPLIAISVGEASGDLLGAHLIEAIQARCPNARFIGIGGPRMQTLGFESLYPQEALAVRGYAEVLRHLPEILRIRKGLIRTLLAKRPDVFVGIDAPDFNLGVAEAMKKAGIASLHYVSPSVWAWRQDRVHKIVRQVDEVLCLFPMEPELYQAAGGKARFVGHPLAETLPLEPQQAEARARLKIEEGAAVFTLMPGSRVSEIDYMAPLFFAAARLIQAQISQAQFLLPYPTAATRTALQAYLAKPEWQDLPIQLIAAHTDWAISAADVVLVASGTATLEVALCKKPMVISYKISPLTYALVKRKLNVPFVGLPNILLNRSAVPELLQHDATPEKLAEAVLAWYRQPDEAAALVDDLRALHQQLRQNSAALAAEAVLSYAQGVKC